MAPWQTRLDLVRRDVLIPLGLGSPGSPTLVWEFCVVARMRATVFATLMQHPGRSLQMPNKTRPPYETLGFERAPMISQEGCASANPHPPREWPFVPSPASQIGTKVKRSKSGFRERESEKLYGHEARRLTDDHGVENLQPWEILVTIEDQSMEETLETYKGAPD